MNLFVPVFLLIFLLSPTTSGNAFEKDDSSRESGISIDLSDIPRDQPRIKQIFDWDGRIVVEAGGAFYRVDVDRQKAVPIFCPGDRSLMSLSGRAGGKNYALCRGDGGFALFAGNDRGWDNVELPETLGSSGNKVFLLSNADRLVFVDDTHIYSFSDGRWKRMPYKQEKRSGERSLLNIDEEDHIILFNDKIFIGHQWGEWGGGLVSLGIDTGTWERHFSGTPVTGLAVNSKGELWASQGLEHLGGVRGMIVAYNGNSWRTVSKNGGTVDYNAHELAFIGVSAENWPFDPAGFYALAFDKDDNLLVLSGSLGILKYKDKRWRRWIATSSDARKSVYVSSLYVMKKDTMLVGLYDGGIAVLDIRRGKYDRITMAESFCDWGHPRGAR